MPLGSSSEAPVINPGPRRPSKPLCAARLEARRRAMRAASTEPPVISVGIGYSAGAALGLSEDWPAAAGPRARVFRGLRHLIRLLIDTVLDLHDDPGAIPSRSWITLASFLRMTPTCECGDER